MGLTLNGPGYPPPGAPEPGEEEEIYCPECDEVVLALYLGQGVYECGIDSDHRITREP